MGPTFRLPISSLLTLAKGSVYFHILSGREQRAGREAGSLGFFAHIDFGLSFSPTGIIRPGPGTVTEIPQRK